MNPQEKLPRLAIIGGTGKEGKGLAYRWAKAGYSVIIGSRTEEKAKAAAVELNKMFKRKTVSGATNTSAAKVAEILVLTVPYNAHASTLEIIRDAAQGKILVDVTVPLIPPKVMKVHIPEGGSAAQEAQSILGDDVRVVSAFQNISHTHLLSDHDVDCDVLITGKGKSARLEVLTLVKAAGMRGWDAGPLENAIVAEGLTSLLIYINKENGRKSAGIRITGVD